MQVCFHAHGIIHQLVVLEHSNKIGSLKESIDTLKPQEPYVLT